MSPIATRIAGLAFATNLLVASPLTSGSCVCHSPQKAETTRWGGNQVVVVVEEKAYREVKGTVQMWDEGALENVLVEIFDNPGYLLDDDTRSYKKIAQKRLA